MKRNKFLKVLSGVLCCFAISGFSLLGLLNNTNENTEVSASMNLNTLKNVDVSFDVDNLYKLSSNATSTLSNYYSSYFDGNEDSGTVSVGTIVYYRYKRCSFTYNLASRYQAYFYNYVVVSLEYDYDSIMPAVPNGYWWSITLSDGANSNVIVLNRNQLSNGSYFDNYSLSFITGSDENNTLLLNVMNVMCIYDGLNTLTVDSMTTQELEGQINELQAIIAGLQNENQQLRIDAEYSYANGYADGTFALENEKQESYDSGYSVGYADGYAYADNQDSIVASIFGGILTVGMLPVNFFLSILNFEILGINLSAFISALLTVALTIIVIKTVTGKGGGGSGK